MLSTLIAVVVSIQGANFYIFPYLCTLSTLDRDHVPSQPLKESIRGLFPPFLWRRFAVARLSSKTEVEVAQWLARTPGGWLVKGPILH